MMTANRDEIEISEVRKRLLQAIEQSQRTAAARQQRIDQAATAYERFLSVVATPLVQRFANVLRVEGYPFTVFTPAGGLRLASGRSGEDYLEFTLETSGEIPAVTLRVSRSRGRRVLHHERPVRERASVDELTQEDVLQALLAEIAPFVER